MAKLIVAFMLIAFAALPDYTSSVLWPCSSDTDCDAQDSTCQRDSGQCACNAFDSVFSTDFTKCLKTSLIGDQCEDTVQCNLMPSGANCKSGVCDCADGHTYVRGRCRALKGLEEPCETDLDCHFGYDRESVQCKDKICACSNGYYHRNGNICRRKSMEINDACVVDADCEDLGSNVTCNILKCQYSEAQEQEVSEKEQSAKTQNQPKLKSLDTDESLSSEGLPTSRLSRSSDSETIKEDLPLEVVNDSSTDHSHGVEAAVTSTHKSREIAVQTSLEGFELNPFNAPLQTRNVVASTTNASTSTSTSARRFHYKRRRQSELRNEDDNDKTLSTLSNTDDDGDGGKYGSFCTETGKACSGLPHSICTNSVCLCRLGYYPKNGKCFAELGEIAESADECEHSYDADTKKCLCEKNYFYERSLRACRKPIHFDLSCTSNSQCSPFGAAYCKSEIPRRCTCEEYAEYDVLRQMCVYKTSLGGKCESNAGCPMEHSVCSNGHCVCKENFFEKDGACFPGLGADCQTEAECVKGNTTCAIHADDHRVLLSRQTTRDNTEESRKTCQCRKGFVHFQDECLKEAEELEDDCLETEQCKPLLASCIDRKCSCTTEQHFKFGRCEDKKGINEPCARAGECFLEKDPENIECRNSVCQCKFGYQTDAEQRHCIRVLPSKNKSSGRPSALKIITFLLIGSAFLITSAAIKQAYY